MTIISFLYHSWIIDDDGNWDERPIWDQQDNLERFASLIVKACDSYVAKRYDECEPRINQGGLLKHFRVEE